MKTIIALTAFSVLTISPAFANPSANLGKLLAGTKSMTANFDQTIKGTQNGRFTGTMAFERPNKFVWHTKTPSDELITANGNQFWVYDKELKQATLQSVSGQLGDTPALLFSSSPAQIDKNFTVKQPKAPTNYFVLTPKGNANFKSLSLSFNSGKPVMMVLNDNYGQTMTIRFSNIVMNAKIPASQFNFTPPKGVEVIKQ